MKFLGLGPKLDKRSILAIRLELRSGEKALPEPLIGAVVVAFSFAEGPSEAAEKSFAAAVAKGTKARVLPDGFSLPVHQWRQYVEHQWPEFADQMPSQSDIAGHLETGAVVFGPLTGWQVEPE